MKEVVYAHVNWESFSTFHALTRDDKLRSYEFDLYALRVCSTSEDCFLIDRLLDI